VNRSGIFVGKSSLKDVELIRRFETPSVPTSLAATHRGFAFYVADPTRSIRRFTQIFFNPEKRELRQRFVHSCIPYLICGNLRNLRISESPCSEIFSHGLTQMGTDGLIRKPGTQESRKGISEIEGKGAMGSAERGRKPSEFQPLPHFLISFFPD
jgi:hypothetical protein